MNILNSIGGGLLSGVRGVGQGLAAAGGGINKYINAMGMDSALSAGIPQDQLTPQAMRGAGRNWLASIGQGMQTGDYVGARQDMQKEMLAKVQMLQQMKQQEAAKQRMAQFQQAAQQVDPRDPASVASLSRAFPEFSETIGKIVDPQHTLAQTAQANAMANKANVDAWLAQLPKPVGVKEYKEGISSDGKSMVVYAFMDDGTPKETGIQVPSWVNGGGGTSFNQATGETKGPAPKPSETPKIIEYNFAVGQGYKGTFDQFRQEPNTPKSAPAAGDANRQDAQLIGDAIIQGKQPPTLTGLRNSATQVRSYLAGKYPQWSAASSISSGC